MVILFFFKIERLIENERILLDSYGEKMEAVVWDEEIGTGHLPKSIHASSANMDRILDRIYIVVTSEMNEMLTASISDKEIERVLFQMGPTKSLSLDGLPALFFQRHWAKIKTKVFKAVREFLAGRDCPLNFNDMILVLIPKVKSPDNHT
jgi:hypothetical protein